MTHEELKLVLDQIRRLANERPRFFDAKIIRLVDQAIGKPDPLALEGAPTNDQ